MSLSFIATLEVVISVPIGALLLENCNVTMGTSEDGLLVRMSNLRSPSPNAVQLWRKILQFKTQCNTSCRIACIVLHQGSTKILIERFTIVSCAGT